MRRLLVIVILSYVIVYYYLDATYWSNTSTNQLKIAGNLPEQKNDKQGINKNSKQADLISQISAKLNLSDK